MSFNVTRHLVKIGNDLSNGGFTNYDVDVDGL